MHVLEPFENAVQDVAHPCLREGGLLEELADIDLEQLVREANVLRPFRIYHWY